ncbi:MAG TPA: class I SAM-dependent methyltransferase [Acidimicrobiales bacterium]|nr:class I SAM-dependent methyltransferase [Acidimicrobiales bacterium]
MRKAKLEAIDATGRAECGMSTDPSRDPLEDVRRHFDELGEREWKRLVQSPRTLVSLELHRRLLRRFVQPGWRVLEIGAGPGRFTVELATMGTTIVVSDVSTVQLELNAQKAREAGRESAVEERRVLDVRDLSEIPDRSFDATVAFGGPISYAFEQAERALSECLRVTQIGGVVLASVMATIGTMRFFLPLVVEESRQYGMEVTDAVLRTGDLRHTPADAHRCRMFRWREILAMIDALPCRLLAASASNATSLGEAGALEWFAGEPGRWQRYLDWEEELAQEPGALDGGTHILFAVEPLDGAERGGDVVVSAPEAGELPPGGTGG